MKIWTSVFVLFLGMNRAEGGTNSFSPMLLKTNQQSLVANSRYKETKSVPEIFVKAVVMPEDRSKPFSVTVQIIANGKTPVAISREQFVVYLSTKEKPYVFTGPAAFLQDAPNVFIIQPHAPITLTINICSNLVDHGSWKDLSAGTYTLEVYIGSGKELEFDYQWLGRTCSDAYMLKIE